MPAAAHVEASASHGLASSESSRASEPPVQGRLHWIDWLRVAAIAGVFVFHTLRPFNTDGWHVKNAETSADLNQLTTIFSSFGLAVLFLLAGAGVRFALRKRSWQAFLRERTARLVVPFAVGTALLSPFQAYLQALQERTYVGSYVDFVGGWASRLPADITEKFSPTVFGIGYHLWFLGFLFAISVVSLPACVWLLGDRGRTILDRWAGHVGWPGAAIAGVIPIYVLMWTGMAFGTSEHDWFEFGWYLAYFMLGFVLVADDRFTAAVRRDGAVALALAILTTALIVADIPAPLETVGKTGGLALWLVQGALFAIEGWAWTIVILNVGLRTAALQRPVRQHLGDAVLPVYVIHQPVILAVAFVVVQWPLGILPKWLAVLGLSLPITLLLVELALRTPVTRLLLGTRVRAGPIPSTAPPVTRLPTARASRSHHAGSS